ncbi:MAG TPA: SMP-30/gluconolactonase/LRE family protein [Pseudonocardiaceae bacterium]|nr:SMP-30/gluconolactonase/LRE family protein [Pseudonocardiaceae bacterium]
MTDLEIALRGTPTLGEGPTWDIGNGTLIWIDILGSAVHRFRPETGTDEVTPLPQHVGAAKPRTNGGLVLNLRDGIGLLAPGGDLTWLVYWARDGVRGNDAAIDPAGRLWAGTMRYDQAVGGGFLARVEPTGRATVVLPSVSISNGIGWSPDHTRMYYVDTPTHRIDVFDCDMTNGDVTNRRPLAEVTDTDGVPDGLCVDADGCVWVAVNGGGQVRRYTADGALDRVLDVPARQVSACCFGGDDLSDLYVTTGREGFTEAQAAAQPLAGCLFVARGITAGTATPRFPG